MNNLIHRSTHIFVINSLYNIFNYRNQYVVQKRSMSKEYCPGFFDLASGGVVNSCDTDIKIVSPTYKRLVSYHRITGRAGNCC